MRNSAVVVQDLSDLDLDEQALIKKSRPWGWFTAGLLGVFLVTFALGYALPLQVSHVVLAEAHAKLAQKAQELDQGLKSARASQGVSEQERGGLERKISAVMDSRRSLQTRIEVAAATVRTQVAALEKAKLLRVVATAAGLEVELSQPAFFLPRSARIAPRFQLSLCKFAAPLAGEKDWLLTVRVPLQEGEKEPWQTAAGQAAAVAKELTDACDAPAERVRAEAWFDSSERADKVLLRLGPPELPSL